MKLLEATGLATLREEGMRPKGLPTMLKSALELAKEIWAEARERGITTALGGCSTPEQWQRRWLPSRRFHLIRMPLNAAALSCQPRTENLVLKKIYAKEDNPIVVDFNRNQVGRTLQGFTPQVVVIDGKHRFAAATLRGETHILAWVGEDAIEVIPSLAAMGSGGGGPKPEATTGAPGARLVADCGKTMKSQSGQETRLANRPGTFAKKMSSVGLIPNPQFKTPTLKPPPLSAEGKRLGTLNVKKIISEYERDKKRGRISGASELRASAPPGCAEMIKGLEDANVENKFAVAWYHYNKYGSCGGNGKEK